MVAVASLRSPGSSPSRLIAIPYRTYRHEPGYRVAEPFACDVLRTLGRANGTYGPVRTRGRHSPGFRVFGTLKTCLCGPTCSKSAALTRLPAVSGRTDPLMSRHPWSVRIDDPKRAWLRSGEPKLPRNVSAAPQCREVYALELGGGVIGKASRRVANPFINLRLGAAKNGAPDDTDDRCSQHECREYPA